MKRTKELEDLSSRLGFSKTYFSENFVIFGGGNEKEVLKKIKVAKKEGKMVIYHPAREEMLRFVLEKTSVDIILGIESIHHKDSVHFVRGGLDQVLGKIASENKKTIAFSFQDILDAKNRPRLLARMAFNFRLCKKYKIKTIFGAFAKDQFSLRSAKDLTTFLRVLEKQRNIYK